MTTTTKTRLDIVAVVGLAMGGVFGIAGTFAGQEELRQVFWAIDGVGLVVATALLTMKYFRKGNDCVAAGFLVFAIAESLLVSGTAAGLAGSVPSFGGGVALWAAALLLTSVPKEFAIGVRLVGVVAALLFAAAACASGRTARTARPAAVEPVGEPEFPVVESSVGGAPRSPCRSVPDDVRGFSYCSDHDLAS